MCHFIVITCEWSIYRVTFQGYQVKVFRMVEDSLTKISSNACADINHSLDSQKKPVLRKFCFCDFLHLSLKEKL